MDKEAEPRPSPPPEPDRGGGQSGGMKVIPFSEHGVKRSQMGQAAEAVASQLSKKGYEAYIVGGSVRDLLVGAEPKDYDIATDARPEQVKKLFRRALIIGRRFRLVHVYIERELIEVATFRRQDPTEGEARRITKDNVYGTLKEDALRRDLTINSLYYRLKDQAILDFTGGMSDIRRGRIRVVGDPRTRYIEDPLRMLRALRFAAKTGFSLDPASAEPMAELRPLLRDVPPMRLYEEIPKLFLKGSAQASLAALRRHNMLCYLFPSAEKELQHEPGTAAFVNSAFAMADERFALKQRLTPAFVYAVFLWLRFLHVYERIECDPELNPFEEAEKEVWREQLRAASLPRTLRSLVFAIWEFQPVLEGLADYSEKKIQGLLKNRSFRLSWYFLQLRSQAWPRLTELRRQWSGWIEAYPQLYKPTRGESRKSLGSDRRRSRPSRQRRSTPG